MVGEVSSGCRAYLVLPKYVFGRNCRVPTGTVLLLLHVCNVIITANLEEMVLKVVVRVFNQLLVVSSLGN